MFDHNLQESHTIEFKILMEFLKEVGANNPSTDEEFKQILGSIQIRPKDFASRLSIPPQTVNSALARMQQKGQISWNKYKYVKLDINQNYAIIHLQNHIHLVQDYLMQSLGISEQEAYEESLKIAPNISCQLAACICEKYHHNTCPGLVILYPECHEHCDDIGGGGG